MNNVLSCLVVAAALAGAQASHAQGPFLPFLAFEAQRRAQTGFPPLDESALNQAAGVQSGAFDRTRSRYVWRFGRDPRPLAFHADYLDDRGNVVVSHPVVISGTVAAVEVPAVEQLQSVARVVIRKATDESEKARE